MRNHPGSSRWALNAVTSVPVKGKQREMGDRQKRGGNVTTEAGTGGMLPQVKECRQPPEAGRGKRNNSPREPQMTTSLLTP